MLGDHRTSKVKKKKKKSEPFLKKRGEELLSSFAKVKSPCSIHEACGGCSYLELAYENELKLKERLLEELWTEGYGGTYPRWSGIVASPHELRHRSKLSLQLKHMRDGSTALGTSPFGSKEVLPFSQCSVVMQGIEKIVPEVHRELQSRDLSGIKRACIVIREGQDGKVDWGGLGRGSLKRAPSDAMMYQYEGKAVRYDLNCFFQSNLGILPELFTLIRESLEIDDNTTFVDLYGGVGLFSVMVGFDAKSILLMEENPDSLVYAAYNKEGNQLDQMKIQKGRVESFLEILKEGEGRWVGVIDPPRSGMTEDVRDTLMEASQLKRLAYLSCNPETQMRDLKHLCSEGEWGILKLIPFDFFPKSYHIETLAILERRS